MNGIKSSSTSSCLALAAVVVLPLLSPLARAGAPAASAAKPDPVVVTNPVTIANPVSTVTIGNTVPVTGSVGITGTANVNVMNTVPVTVTNPVSTVTIGNTVPVTGTVNIGTMPGLKVDTTTPLKVMTPPVYSITVSDTVPISPDNTISRLLVTLPAPALLETISGNCEGAASYFAIGGAVASAGHVVSVVDSYGNLAATGQWNSEIFSFPNDPTSTHVSVLLPTPVNVAYQSVIYLEASGDLIGRTPGLVAFACSYTLTLRDLN